MTGGPGIPSRPWLLVSDIDETLTGDAAALEALAAAVAASRDRLWVAVNSSRPSRSVAETLSREFPAALVPDAVITALGTEIALNGEALASWDARFAGWPAGRVHEILSGFGHRPHAPQYQTALKVSYAVPPGGQAAVREALSAAGIACRIIASGSDDFDVIPQGAGKGEATLHLAAELGLAPGRLVVSGDSGNDLAMFEVAERRIAVGNARAELVNALEPGTFYHADAFYAGGVLEGLIHFGVLPGETTGKSRTL